jgi:hypothetical protein
LKKCILRCTVRKTSNSAKCCLGFTFDRNPARPSALQKAEVCDALQYYYFSRRNIEGATAVQLEKRLPGNVTTFSLNTSDAEMTELKCIKLLTQFEHLDNNRIHSNIFYSRPSCHSQNNGYAFCGRQFNPSRHRLRQM